jgi:hypothetical protein
LLDIGLSFTFNLGSFLEWFVLLLGKTVEVQRLLGPDMTKIFTRNMGASTATVGIASVRERVVWVVKSLIG